MNCNDARAALPLSIYGEASPQEQAALKDHLGGCPACRREQQALTEVQHLLDAAPTPEVAVDLPRLYQSLAARQSRPLRRWQGAALVLGAVAAVLLLFIGLRLEVRLGQGQLVVRWGDGPPAAPTHVPPEPIVKTTPAQSEIEAEVHVLRELIHALTQDVDDRDQRFAERLERLQRHVQVLQTQAEQRWSTTEQDVAALYLLSRKGEKP